MNVQIPLPLLPKGLDRKYLNVAILEIFSALPCIISSLLIKNQGNRIATLRYFLSRPFGSKLSAWVSNQSEVISSRKILETKMREIKAKFKNGDVPIPNNWGGIRVVPRTFEFWQGQPNRLHDRICYTLHNGSWKIERLAP